MEIVKSTDLIVDNELPHHYLEDIRNIFFEASAVKNFSSEEFKEDFFHKWCLIYFECWDEFCYLAIEDNHVIGYAVGCPDSESAVNVLMQPGFDLFTEYFDEFPSHLQVVVKSEHRNKGIGEKLVNTLGKQFLAHGSHGMFIITGAMHRSTRFYMKNGFNHSYTYAYGTSALLMMGKELY